MSEGIENNFSAFWENFPRRKGDAAKTPAKLLFIKLVQSGVDPMDIINGAKKFAALERDKIGTKYIMQAQKWLRNQQWLDFKPEPQSPSPPVRCRVFVHEESPQWTAWQAHLQKTKGSRSPCVNFGWYFPTEWPPTQEKSA